MNNINHYEKMKELLYLDSWGFRALKFAEYMHKGQKRKYGKQEDYMHHIKNVWSTVCLTTTCKYVRIAAILHDVLEDTKSTQEDILFLFNQEVLDLILQVTKKSDGKFDIKSREAMIIKCADLLDNLPDAPEEYIKKKLELFKDW